MRANDLNDDTLDLSKKTPTTKTKLLDLLIDGGISEPLSQIDEGLLDQEFEQENDRRLINMYGEREEELDDEDEPEGENLDSKEPTGEDPEIIVQHTAIAKEAVDALELADESYRKDAEEKAKIEQPASTRVGYGFYGAPSGAPGPTGPMPIIGGTGFAHATNSIWDAAASYPTNVEVGLGNVQNLDQTDPSNIVQDATHRFTNDDSIIHAKNVCGSGVKLGGIMSINVDSTKIDIAPMEGIIVDNTDPNNPIEYTVSYPGATGIPVMNIATANITYIGIDATNTVIQQTTEFTPMQRRTLIILGAAIHSNKVIVNAINNLPDIVLSTISQFNDLVDSLRNFNTSGNVVVANGANLSINKSEGYIFKRGSNFVNDHMNPHKLYMASSIAPATLRYRLSDGTEYANTAVLDPANYESPLGTRVAVGANKFSIQRLVLFPSNLMRIQYGQAEYGSMALAVAAISTEAFVQEANMKDNGLLRAIICIKNNATNLTDVTQAQIFEADRFGSTRVATGAAGPNQVTTNTDTNITGIIAGAVSKCGAVVPQAHIINADGNLTDITTKFNTLLAQLESLGLLATS